MLCRGRTRRDGGRGGLGGGQQDRRAGLRCTVSCIAAALHSTLLSLQGAGVPQAGLHSDIGGRYCQAAPHEPAAATDATYVQTCVLSDL